MISANTAPGTEVVALRSIDCYKGEVNEGGVYVVAGMAPIRDNGIGVKLAGFEHDINPCPGCGGRHTWSFSRQYFRLAALPGELTGLQVKAPVTVERRTPELV